MTTENIYIGSATTFTMKSGDEIIKVQLDLTDLARRKGEYEEFVKTVEFKDGPHRLLNIVVAPMKPENQKKWKTHSVKIDTYKKPEERDVDQSEDPPF